MEPRTSMINEELQYGNSLHVQSNYFVVRLEVPVVVKKKPTFVVQCDNHFVRQCDFTKTAVFSCMMYT